MSEGKFKGQKVGHAWFKSGEDSFTTLFTTFTNQWTEENGKLDVSFSIKGKNGYTKVATVIGEDGTEINIKGQYVKYSVKPTGEKAPF